MKKLLIFLLAILCFEFYSQSTCWQIIKAGEKHALGIKPNGELWGWGYCIGVGDSTVNLFNCQDRYIPVKIGKDTTWRVIGAGKDHSAGIKANGSLWTWGENFYGQLGEPTLPLGTRFPIKIDTSNQWLNVITGDYFSFALKNNGSLWGWGRNVAAILGDTTYTNKSIPTQVGTSTNWLSYKIATGEYHVVALKNDGTIWGWGGNNYGQLGDSMLNTKFYPTQIGSDNDWKYIDAGSNHTMGIKNNGTLWGWGENQYGKLGNGNTINKYFPTQIGTDTTWKAISLGRMHSIGIKKNGTLWAWGYNEGGITGDDIISTWMRSSPTQVGTDTNWVSVESGVYGFAFATKTNGTVWSWGHNWNGVLGLGSPSIFGNINIPIQFGCPFTGIEELLTTKSSFTIYPNPAYNKIHIKNINSLVNRIIITDILGIQRIEIKGDTEHIDIHDLPNGLYHLAIFSKNSNYSYKFIKE